MYGEGGGVVGKQVCVVGGETGKGCQGKKVEGLCGVGRTAIGR